MFFNELEALISRVATETEYNFLLLSDVLVLRKLEVYLVLWN